MINQPISSTNRNVFAPMQSSGVSYAITKPFTETQKQEHEKEKEKKGNKLGYQIATVALATGFGVLILTKGLPKSARLKVNEIFKKLEEKSAQLTDKGKGQTSKLEVFYLRNINKLKKLAQYSQGAFNFAPLKDAPPKVLSRKIPIMEKVWSKISVAFEKISVATSKKSYLKTSRRLENMYGVFAETNTKIPTEQAKVIEQKIAGIKIKYNNAFGIEARSKRLAEAKIDMGNIDERFLDRTLAHPIRMIHDKRFYTTFISEDLAAPAKIKLNNKVSKLKAEITLSPRDNYTSIKKLLTNLDTFIDPVDKENRASIRKLWKNLEKYKNSSSIDVSTKETMLNTLKELSDHLSSSGKYDKKITEPIAESIKILSNDKKGGIQELLGVYKEAFEKGHVSKEQYTKLVKSVDKSLKSFDVATDMETDKLFDKIRDIQIGSAPMDVLGVLSSFAVVVAWLAKADNKDERISAALKFGIPAIGAVAISTYCTLGLVSGGKALLLGLIAGKMINILGVILDKARKKYKETPPTLLAPEQILPAIKEKVESVQA